MLQALIRTWSRIFIFDAGRNVEYRLRRDLFAHLTRLDPAFYRRHPTGDVMSRLTNDLGAVRALFGPGLLNLLNTALVYATALALLLRLSPRLTLLALIPYPLLLGGGAARQPPHPPRQPRDPGAARHDVDGDPGGPGRHRGDQALRAGGVAPAAFRAVNDEYLDRALTLVRARGALMPLFAMLGGVGTLIVLWAGGREVIAGRMSVGSLVAFNGYLVLLSWPTFALGWIIGIWQRGIAAWARVRELLDDAARRSPTRCDNARGAAEAPPPRRRRSRCAT